jgi:hypothetical protein
VFSWVATVAKFAWRCIGPLPIIPPMSNASPSLARIHRVRPRLRDPLDPADKKAGSVRNYHSATMLKFLQREGAGNDGNKQLSPILPGLVPQFMQTVINATANMAPHRNDRFWLVMDAPRGSLSGQGASNISCARRYAAMFTAVRRAAREALLFAQGCLTSPHCASSNYLDCSL